MADRFSRFNEERDFQGGNHFDQYEEGQLDFEQASLDKPIESDNIGHRLLQKHGWRLGQGLGKTMQGRTDPVPIILKYDVMGMGRMEMEMDYAEDATEKRRVLEVEKEDTEELRQKYKDYAEKEKAIAKALEDLRANFYCELCDKQYQKHQEFDNHINSYDHAHKQRLKELKQREFARNVSSRSRKDGRKQEKMLRRLHELAEQRKQQDCVPGSGPMFRQTTVEVDGEKGEDIDGIPMTMDCTTEGSSGEEKGSCIGGQGSPRPSPAISFSLRKNTSSPTPSGGSQAPKVSVSFSFAKKAPVKLETAAAVFADPGEEALEGEESLDEGAEKAVGEEAAAPTSTTASPQGGAGGGDDQPQSDDGGTLASTLNKLKMMMKKEEGYTGQEPQYYHYMPPAHCRVKPHFQFLLFMKASDQCGSREEDEDGEEEEKTAPTEGDGDHEEPKDNICKSEKEQGRETMKGPSTNPTFSPRVKLEEGSDGVPAVETNADQSNTTSQTSEAKQGATETQDTGPRLLTGPFFPVLSKDESTTLQWPSELLEFTKAQPSLSYSCNPLYFDFKLSRNKGNRAGKGNKLGKPANTESGEGSKTEAATSSASAIEEASSATPPGTGDDKKEESSSKEKLSGGENKDNKLEGTEDGGSKKKKKKKKHKKSSKHSKRKEKERLAMEGEMETEMPGEKTKKKKKHKRKKGKNKLHAEEEEEEGKEQKDKGGASGSAPPAGGTLASEGGKRKRAHKEVSQRSKGEESGAGKVNSSEEHNGTKRLKSDPSTSAASCSASAQKSPGGGRPPSSESDEDGGSSSQRSRPPHRRSTPPREQRRHHSEDSRRSGRSRSRSSRRGDRNHRRNRGQASRSQSYSSSSERSTAGSSAYSWHSHSYSDSYSDYSDGERRRRSKRRSSDSEYDRRSGGRSHRRHYSSSSSEDDSRSRSRSHSRRKHHRRRHHRSSSRSYSRSSRSCSTRSYRHSSYSYSHSPASSSSSSVKGSPHRRSHGRRADSSTRRRDFNRSRIYRSQSPRSSSSRAQPRNSNSSMQLNKGGSGGGSREGGASEHRNSLTARQLLEKIQSRKGGEDSGTGSKPGVKIKDPPQGFFGPKLPPALGNKSMLPLFGKLQAGKKLPLTRPDDGEKSGQGKGSDTSGEVILVEPIREFPPPPPPPPPPVQQQQQQVEEPVPNAVGPEDSRIQTSEAQVLHESQPLFEQETANIMPPYQGEPGQDPNNPIVDGRLMGPDMSQQPALHAYPGYPMPSMEEEDVGMEPEEDGLAPLESQPITFTPEEMEKYSKLQQAAQQHIQQQLLAKQVKTFPSAAAANLAAAAAAAANLAPAPPPPPAALQQIHIQQPTVSAASATSITTVQHAILQHHAAATAMGIHPHTPHHTHPAHAQLAQVHHIPQHHLTPISLSPLGHTLGHSLGHSLGPTGLIPAHPSAFLSGQPIHIIPASALHHAPLALHHVPHAALYPTLFAPRPATAAAAAALQLHPLLHPIFSGQDLQHPPSHGS
ncbi:G patch domain-containing protein 8 isoform X1 [Electrophorus electricus]|uniref:G-patch domain-containing protein n=1 Tax=Electrophorus electricus TaxID=8005 RepID=A0A4W4E7F5_ELEEL|nr:G patch domain-containing protein 8 isoform X1 [Electrophorus electricus]